ncbi:PREDICTED: transmembrane protein 54 [Nanorana parkeri]|uniref:transmembrane protein 54 n=1 Tax=Nanorana parkeri TaxID=125878 RepID=UPI000854F8F6|nr:PREDICTED: transmembrane protein 54 [Nanorana parkeri]
MCGPRALDSSQYGKVLMKVGLALIVIGHLNFIVGAIIHGLVLRHVGRHSLHYSVTNIIAVASSILTISCGIVAIVLSRYLKKTTLRWATLLLSITNAVLSAASTVGIAVSVVMTVANGGRTLLSSCTFTHLQLIQISYECPFDPTRIYSTTLCLWVISILLDATEVVFSARCYVTVLRLMDVQLCRKKKMKIRITIPVEEEEEGLNGRGSYNECV